MKWLIDAQLPARLAVWLQEQGEDAVHTSQLPNANCSTDHELIELAKAEGRILVSKDSDFRTHRERFAEPEKLLVVAIGNIRNNDLMACFQKLWPALSEAFEQFDLIEMYPDRLVAID